MLRGELDVLHHVNTPSTLSISLLSPLPSPQDPSNLQGKVQKHQAFEAELSANQSRIDALQKSGQELLDGKHYAADEVSGRMEEVSSQWKKLLEATELKGTATAHIYVFFDYLNVYYVVHRDALGTNTNVTVRGRHWSGICPVETKLMLQAVK